MVIMAPKDENELRHMLKTAMDYNDGPISIRYPRGHAPGVAMDDELTALTIPSWEILRQGEDAAVLAIGSAVSASIMASDLLRSEGINVTIVNARFAKPIDKNLLETIAQKHYYLVTVEENILMGGFGSAVLEYLSDLGIKNNFVKRIGLPDCFIEHGSQEELRNKYGLTPEKIADAIKVFIREEQGKEGLWTKAHIPLSIQMIC